MHFIDLDIPIFNYLTTLSNVFFFTISPLFYFIIIILKWLGISPSECDKQQNLNNFKKKMYTQLYQLH